MGLPFGVWRRHEWKKSAHESEAVGWQGPGWLGLLDTRCWMMNLVLRIAMLNVDQGFPLACPHRQLLFSSARTFGKVFPSDARPLDLVSDSRGRVFLLLSVPLRDFPAPAILVKV